MRVGTERDVEIPWLIEHLGKPGALLDIGSAGATYHVDLIQCGAGRIVCIDPRPFSAPPPIEALSLDARKLPAEWGDRFDLVTCVSVLDHVGLDAYGLTADATALAAVIAEMWRVLKPGGRALITVPFGRDLWTTHPGGGQRVFSMDSVVSLFAAWDWKSTAAYRWDGNVYAEVETHACDDANYLGCRAEAAICLELETVK